jgi:2-methylisocitrate lyase-like PEP mutase family enzyme
MGRSLRQRIENNEFILAPGVGDAFGGILAERAGFDCIHMSGYYVAALLGYPDVGLVTLTEMVDQATRLCDTVSSPVIADADNGYGNAINVIRTVREFERAGVAAIHLEDQVAPKKCGHMQGHVLVSTSEMCGKIEAAVEARRSRDFLVIARSDAIKNGGIEEAIRRGNEYRRAGSDAVMVMAPSSVDDLKRYRDGVEGPLVVTIGSWDFTISNAELQKIGYQVVIYPLSAFRRGIVAMLDCLGEIKKKGVLDHTQSSMMPMHDLHGLVGLGRIQQLEGKYLRDRAAE